MSALNSLSERQKAFFLNLSESSGYSVNALKWAWEHICDYLDEASGCVYVSDFAFGISETENCNGYVDSPNVSNAKQWVAEHFDDCARYWYWEHETLGEHQRNPFDDPVAYQCCVFIQLVEVVIDSSQWIDEHWQDQVELTPEVIAQLKYELCITDDEPETEE